MGLEKDKYALVLPQELVWGDMDAFQHINNTVYFRYFEDIRMAFFDKIGVNDHMRENKVGPILARTECNFRLPLIYPDKIDIGTNVEVLSPRKFNMTYTVFSEKHQGIAAEGSGLIVFYDYHQNTVCNIPEVIIDALT